MSGIRRLNTNFVPDPTPYLKYRHCDRKAKFKTESYADHRRLGMTNKDILEVYECRYCKHFHIGRMLKVQMKALRLAS